MNFHYLLSATCFALTFGDSASTVSKFFGRLSVDLLQTSTEFFKHSFAYRDGREIYLYYDIFDLLY